MKTTFPSTSENGKGNYRDLRIHTDLTAQCCSKASLEDYERVITLRNSFSLCCFALRTLNGLLSSQFPERITSCSLWAISSDGFGIPWNKATQGWGLLGTWRRATWGLCKSSCAYCKTNVKKFLVFTDKHTRALKKKKWTALLFLLNQDERKGLFMSLLVHQGSPLFPVLTLTLHSTHLPISLRTKEDQLTFPPRPQILYQTQQAESQTIMEPDFAILFAPLPPLKLKPHVSVSHYCSQKPSPPPAQCLLLQADTTAHCHQGHSSLQQ